jgi:HEAT repeat protein
MAYWIAGQIADGTLDPATGTHHIWADIAYDLGYPEELEPLVHCAHNLDGWEESWGVSLEDMNKKAVEAAKQFLGKGSAAQAGS